MVHSAGLLKVNEFQFEQCPFEGLKAQKLKSASCTSDVAVKAGASAPAEQPNADANVTRPRKKRT